MGTNNDKTDDVTITEVLRDPTKNLFEVLRGNADDGDDDSERGLLDDLCDSKYYDPAEFIQETSGKLRNNNTISILNLNIDNLSTKLDSLQMLICGQLVRSDFKFDIIALTETHTKHKDCNFNQNSYTPEELENLIPGYYFIGKSRRTARKGGVGVLICKSLKHLVSMEEAIFDDECFESIILSINHEKDPMNRNFNKKKKKLAICIMYLPKGIREDQQKVTSSLEETISVMERKAESCIICGDMNVNLLNYNTDPKVREFAETFMSYSFKLRISRPTRIKHTSCTLIDHFWDNIENSQETSGVLVTQLYGNSGWTDHYPCFLVIDQSLQRQKAPKTFVRRRDNSESRKQFRSELSKADFTHVYCEDPSESLEHLMSIIKDLHDECFPWETVKVRKSNYKVQKFVTQGIMKACQNRDKMRKQIARKNIKPTSKTYEHYKQYRNTLTSIIRSQKKAYYGKEFERHRGDIKKTMSTLNELIRKSNDKHAVLSHKFQVGDEWIEDRSKIAEGFNEFYADVGPALDRQIKPATKTPEDYLRKLSEPNVDEFVLENVTAEEVIKVCQKMKKKTSTDHYGISQKTIMNHIEILAPVIVHLWSRCRATGLFPDGAKKAKTVPVHKGKGLKDYLYTNYRPISLLSIIGKILERLIYNQLTDFLLRYNILFKSQHGFREGHSTTHAMIDFISSINEALDKGELSYGVFCDLSKAFDTINHQILFKKLDHYGIRGMALNLLKNYFTGRSQFVSFNGENSGELPLSTGVPQGSILGPLIFLIYVNDLSASTDALRFVTFADDSNLLIHGKDPKDTASKLSAALVDVTDWFRANRLLLNVSKTNLIVFKSPKCRIDTKSETVLMDGEPLKQVGSERFLGLIVDEKLDWQCHANKVASTISRKLGMMRKVKKTVGLKTLKAIYNSFILPQLNFGLAVWGGATESVLKQVKTLQKKAIRLLTNAKSREHTEPRQKALGILKLEHLYKVQVSLLVRDSLLGSAPTLFEHMFTRRSESVSTRHSQEKKGDVFLIKGKSRSTRQSFPVRGSEIWNELPTELHDILTKSKFKKRIKNYFLSSYVKKVECKNMICCDIRHCRHV
jgi:exonuclease III